MISRLRGSISGYSGFFDFVHVDEDLLDDVYEHDAAMMQKVETLADLLDGLATQTTDPGQLANDLLAKIDAVELEVDKREDLLKGLGGGS